MTAQSAERKAESAGGEWIPAGVVAELVGLDEKNVRRRCYAGKWDHRYVPGESGGRRLEVNLASLPEAAQSAWRMAQSEGRQNGSTRQVPAADPEGAGGAEKGQQAASSGQEAGSTGQGAAGAAVDPAIRGAAGDRKVPGETSAGGDTDPWEAARDADREIAVQRLSILEAWAEFVNRQDAKTAKARLILEFVQHWNLTNAERQAPSAKRLSRGTLYRWARLFRERGRAGLLPGWATGPQDQGLAPEIRDRFDQVYLAPQRLSLAIARRIVHGQFALEGSPLAQAVPSAATFRRYVASLPRATVTLAREGEAAFRRQFEPHVERDYTTIRVMQCWASDHTIFDFFCRDEAGRAIRPWLTLWMDTRSRRRVGWLVHTGPSQDTVLAALAMGVLRFGIPDEAYTDNGRDFSVLTIAGASRRWRLTVDQPRVRAMTEHLGMLWHFALPRQPQGKGGIERAFGVDRQRFDRLWGSYCGADNQEKPEGLAALLKHPRSLPTLAQVQEAYGRYVTEVADVLPHEGQGMDGRSPREVFEAEEYVKRTATADTLRLLLMRCSRPVTVQRNGLWAFDRWYWSEVIAACHGQELYYRYSLDDLSVIHCFSLQDQLIGSVTRRELVGVTSQDHRKYVREKQAIRRAARVHLANLDKRASAPDALAAIGASARLDRPGTPRPEDPDPAQRVVQVVRTPLAAAAKIIKAEKQHQQKMAAIEAEVAPKVRQIVGSLSGDPAPVEDDGGAILRRFYQHTKQQEKAS